MLAWFEASSFAEILACSPSIGCLIRKPVDPGGRGLGRPGDRTNEPGAGGVAPAGNLPIGGPALSKRPALSGAAALGDRHRSSPGRSRGPAQAHGRSLIEPKEAKLQSEVRSASSYPTILFLGDRHERFRADLLASPCGCRCLQLWQATSRTRTPHERPTRSCMIELDPENGWRAVRPRRRMPASCLRRSNSSHLGRAAARSGLRATAGEMPRRIGCGRAWFRRSPARPGWRGVSRGRHRQALTGGCLPIFSRDHPRRSKTGQERRMTAGPIPYRSRNVEGADLRMARLDPDGRTRPHALTDSHFACSSSCSRSSGRSRRSSGISGSSFPGSRKY